VEENRGKVIHKKKLLQNKRGVFRLVFFFLPTVYMVCD
jgi:hypothetical protein